MSIFIKEGFFLLTGLPVEVHHDFYKAKFMAAVRLWRKHDEDKKVMGMFELEMTA